MIPAAAMSNASPTWYRLADRNAAPTPTNAEASNAMYGFTWGWQDSNLRHVSGFHGGALPLSYIPLRPILSASEPGTALTPG